MARKVAQSQSLSGRDPARWVPSTSRRWWIVASGVAVIGAVVAVKSYVGTGSAEAQVFGGRGAQGTAERQAAHNMAATKHAGQLPRAQRPQHDVMAVVNGQDIRREALATACVDRYGKEVLEGLVNKRLIEHHCRNRGLSVSDAEIDAEINRMAERFKIGRQQWLEMMQKERGINEQQYKRDILWPTLALRKLADDELRVSEQQIREAHESQFRGAVKCRLVVVGSREQAESLHRQLVDRPADFPRLAMQHSQDVNSASIGGRDPHGPQQ